jgi:hypothetical protein
MQPQKWVPLGYARFATLSSAVALATTQPTAGFHYSQLAKQPKHAIITVYTQNVRVRDDGVAPTATEGEQVAAGSKIIIENSPEAIQEFRAFEEAASAVITVRYYA